MKFYKLTSTRTLPTNNITIDGDKLTIEIRDTTAVEGLGESGDMSFYGEASLSELISTLSQDHGCIAAYPWNMAHNAVFRYCETTQLTIGDRVKLGETFNTEKSSAPGKQFAGCPFSAVNTRYQSYPYLYILTPTINCAVEDLVFLYRESDSVVVTVNGSEITPEATVQSTKGFLDSWRDITIDGPDTVVAGTKAQFTTNAPEGSTVYLTSDIGVVNRAKVTNGRTFTLDTDGLEPGEIVTIKAGYKFWSGVFRKIITLT